MTNKHSALLENIVHMFVYLLNVSDIEKREIMFSSTGRNICQSLRSIISTLFYVHSLCLCWVHTCVFSLLLGEEEKDSKNPLCHFERSDKKKGGQEDYSMTGEWNSAMRYSSKYSSNRFIETTAQLCCKHFQRDKNLGFASQNNYSEQHGHLTHTFEAKTNDAVLWNGTTHLTPGSIWLKATRFLKS